MSAVSPLILEIKKLMAAHPEITATAAGGLLGGAGEAANVFFSLDPADVGQAEYDRRVRKNFMRGLFVGAGSGLAGAHIYQRVQQPSFAQKSAMITIKVASLSAATPAAPGHMLSSALEKLRGSPLLQAVLASGLIGAGAGGTLTAMAPKDPGEDRSARRKRILRNALLMGAMSAGGVGALGMAGKNLATALPANDRGSPLESSAVAGMRVAPGLAAGGLRGFERVKDERAGASRLMSSLVNAEAAQGPFTGTFGGGGEGVKGAPGKAGVGPLTKHLRSQTGVFTAGDGRTSTLKGSPDSPSSAIRALLREKPVHADAVPNMAAHMREIGKDVLTPEALRAAGINPALADAERSAFATAKGYGALWKDRFLAPGGGRLGRWGAPIAAGVGLFTPEIANGLLSAGRGAVGALQGADAKAHDLLN